MKKFFLDLGKQPLANNYLKKYKKKQTKYNLKLYFDSKSKLVSISKRIPSKKMFNNNYPYRSSISKTMNLSFLNLSKEIKKKFKPNLILEIGSNDGVFLKNFNKQKIIGVEPCLNLAKITKKLGYKTYNNYWDLKFAKRLIKTNDKFNLVYSSNTITHISDLNNVFRSISDVLTNEGIVIIEDPSLIECLKKTSYDQFYNEHIYVFSALSLKNILKKNGFEIFDIKSLTTHGGSLRYYIKRYNNKNIPIKLSVKKQLNKEINYGLNNFKTYKKFNYKTKLSKIKLVNILKNIKMTNKKIIGYGATAKASTILNYCNINNDLINYFIDTTPAKQNKFMPGKKIKIFKYSQKIVNNVDYIFLGAWNFKNEIFNKEKKFIKRGGKFIIHVPYPKII